MAREPAYRKYQITINNPMDHGFSHEVITSIISDLSGIVYWCLSDEVGENGTPHTHIFLLFRNAVMFSTLHKRFYGAHIEPAKGTNQENRDYIRKEGKWSDSEKSETSIEGSFKESGELPEERSARQKQSAAILEMIKNGASDIEIISEFPSSMTQLHHIDNVRQAILAEKYRYEYRQLYVEYIWGETGVGKTRSIADKYGYGNFYRVTDYEHPFDQYEGEDVIVFDEFRSTLTISKMLVYLDGHPVTLPCRFNNKVACYTKAYVISNIPMEQQYPNIQIGEPATWKAWLRRFACISEMLPSGTTFADVIAEG